MRIAGDTCARNLREAVKSQKTCPKWDTEFKEKSVGAASEESSDTNSDLHCIDPWVRCRQPCVRDVHITQFDAYVVSLPKNVHAECGLVHEVNRICAGWDVMVGEKHTTSSV